MSKVLGLSLLAMIAAAPAAAQVGHAPESSPYRPVLARQVVSAVGGYLGGERGIAGVGPSDGQLYGARFDMLFSGPVNVTFEAALADLERNVIDPTQGPDDRAVGTFAQKVLLADIGINLVLTGAKTWHGFAPYVGGALGLAVGERVGADSSGFNFRTQFLLAPQLGIRWHPADRLMFRVEGRDVIWRLSYPAIFFQEPANAPGAPSVLDPVTTNDSDWTHHWTVSFSLGFAIKL